MKLNIQVRYDSSAIETNQSWQTSTARWIFWHARKMITRLLTQVYSVSRFRVLPCTSKDIHQRSTQKTAYHTMAIAGAQPTGAGVSETNFNDKVSSGKRIAVGRSKLLREDVIY
jgi:hypothetical protein